MDNVNDKLFCFQFFQNTKLNQHLFWVAVGILQLGESTLYAAGLGLMEACIKILTNIEAFEEQVRIPRNPLYSIAGNFNGELNLAVLTVSTLKPPN